MENGCMKAWDLGGALTASTANVIPNDDEWSSLTRILGIAASYKLHRHSQTISSTSTSEHRPKHSTPVSMDPALTSTPGHTAVASAPAPLSTEAGPAFPQFPKLPLELQNHVWTSCLLERRAIGTYLPWSEARTAMTPVNVQYITPQSSEHSTSHRSVALHLLLPTCHNSRSLALELLGKPYKYVSS